jgi:hypothetical protein
MGRLVLIEFDNREEANAFVEEHHIPQATPGSVRIVGVFIMPAMLCECQPKTDKSFRGSRFGLWACTTCRKVKPFEGQILFDVRKGHVRAKDRTLWIGVRFKMENGKVVTVTDE